MKKFALLLAVALPMVFASCGKDDDEPKGDGNFVMPCTKWGATKDQVKKEVKGFHLYYEDEDELAYSSDKKEFVMPAYVYLFNDEGFDGLCLSELTVDPSQDKDLYKWLSSKYTEIELPDDVEYIAFADASGELACVMVAVPDEENNEIIAWSAGWMAPDMNTKGVDVIDLVKRTAQKALSL